jgi:hypothetical protein
LHEISVFKITLLLLHVIPVLNQMGPTHTRILDMIFVSFFTFVINKLFYGIFVYYSVFQKKITFDEILYFVEDEQFKYLVLESINDGPKGRPNNLPQPAWRLAELFFWSDMS